MSPIPQTDRHDCSGLVEEDHGMRIGVGHRGDFGAVEAHRVGVAAGHDGSRPLTLSRAGGAVQER